jgi:hypothetical protein
MKVDAVTCIININTPLFLGRRKWYYHHYFVLSLRFCNQDR